MCNCESYKKLADELKLKDELIEILKDSLNDPKYCEHHIVFRKCSKKGLQCGDCIIQEFYDSLSQNNTE